MDTATVQAFVQLGFAGAMAVYLIVRQDKLLSSMRDDLRTLADEVKAANVPAGGHNE